MSFRTFTNTDLSNLLKEQNVVISRCSYQNCNARVIPVTRKLQDSITSILQSPQMMKAGDSDNESLNNNLFYQIADVWDFDNIGVSKPSEEIANEFSIDGSEASLTIQRLLVCSECDRGPIGFAALNTAESNDVKNLKYFLSCESVVYQVCSQT